MHSDNSQKEPSDKPIIIAMDGTGASGKGSIARLLAQRTGFDRLDTGLMYRYATYSVIANDIPFDDTESIVSLLKGLDFLNIPNSNELSSDVVSRCTSKYIAPKQVFRDILNEAQFAFPDGKEGCIVDGRDIGTDIFPNANFKFFITADLETRAMRRYKQLQKRSNDVQYADVLKAVKERDEFDVKYGRFFSEIPADYVVIDTTNALPDECADLLFKMVHCV